MNIDEILQKNAELLAEIKTVRLSAKADKSFYSARQVRGTIKLENNLVKLLKTVPDRQLKQLFT